MTEIQKKIEQIKEKKQISRFYISVNEVEKYIDGFVLDSSEQFVLLRECVDFDTKGLVIIPSNKITKLRQSKMERSFTKIYKAEKLIDKATIFNKISLESFILIFKAIKYKYKYVIVENVFQGSMEFCIGEIKRINKSSVSILYFDITGKVDNETTTIPFEDIANIEFDSNYINTFIKHLK